jgi:hypothetical protein
MSGSDFSLTDTSSIRAVFDCDGDSVRFFFVVNSETTGLYALSREEAAKTGAQVAETGFYDKFPVTGAPLSAVQRFGLRLKQYGESGS